VDAVALLASDPARAAILLDVDGTLAPIVAEPAAARVPSATQAELRRLADRYALVACISGRPAADARTVVGIAELTYVGEHGLELDPRAAAWAERIHAFASEAGRSVERKPHSVAFHFRTAPDEEAARRGLEEIAASAEAEGFRTRWGRKVLEVLPPIDASKRTAVETLLGEHELSRALYAGDDTTDLDAFAALDSLDVAVRVAVSSSEGPGELAARADVVVASPEEVVELLRRL
jgi:trehalose 6-phosphate phosphatase